jgi:putative DNA primase/helicase
MDDKEGAGSWICNQCGAGSGVDLVMKVLNLDFKTAVTTIRGVLGTTTVTKPQKERKVSKEYLRELYVGSNPVKKGDIVSKYLENRGLSVFSDKLRYHPACYEPETKKKMPAMLATYMLPEGLAITIHRTFLTPDGEKAKIESPKKILPALKKMTGGAIRLFEPKDGLIGIAEGIETALAVHELIDIPVWSVVSSALMSSFEPPPGIKSILIFSDRDANFAGQKAAYTLANHLAITRKIHTEVHLPTMEGDFLDELVNVNRKDG